MKIPLIKLPLNKDDARAVSDVVKSGQIGLGEKVFEFERALAKYVGCKYAVATDSCTSALFLSIKYYFENRYIKEVGIPSLTVPLVANAAMEADCNVYFTDNVDWVGTIYNIEGTSIWDSAHQLYRGMYKDYGGTICLSFYPTKPIGSADGGAILTNNKKFADWARIISCYGRDQTQKYQNSWEYETKVIGYKRHYTNLQAALCLSQLKRLDETNEKRAKIRDYYNEELFRENKSLYLYRYNVNDRDRFVRAMQEQGITCGVHYKPMHTMKAYKDFRFEGDKEKVMGEYKTTVSLPFHSKLTKKEADKVIRNVFTWMYDGR